MALLNTDQAAAKLGITRRWIKHLIDRGQLPAVRVGRAYVIEERDLAAVRLPGRGWPKGKARGKREKGE